MPSGLSFTLEDADFQILKESKSLQVFDLQTQEKVGEFETPTDLLKSSQPALATKLKKEAQNEGLSPTSYKINFFLVLGKESNDSDELGFIEHEDAIMVASEELSKVEVNGFKEYTLYILAVLE